MPWSTQLAPNFGFATDVAPWTASAGTVTWLSTDGKHANGCLQVAASFAGANSSFAIRVPVGTTANMASLTGQSGKSWRGAAQCKLVSTTAGTIRVKIYARAFDSAGAFLGDVSLGSGVSMVVGSWLRIDQYATVATITAAQPTAVYVQTMIQPINDAGDGTAGTFTLLVDEIVGQFGDPSNVWLNQYLSGDGDERSNRILNPAGVFTTGFGPWAGNSTRTDVPNVADGPGAAAGGPSTCLQTTMTPTSGYTQIQQCPAGGDPASGNKSPASMDAAGYRRLPSASGSYTASAWIKPVGFAPSAYTIIAYFRDGNGDWVTSSELTTGVTPVANTWSRISATWAVPAKAEWATYYIVARGLTTGQSYTLRWTGFIDAASASVPSYFDGSTAGARWSGTANASASFMPMISRTTSAARGPKESALTDDERVNLFSNPLPSSTGTPFITEGQSTIQVIPDASSPTGQALVVKPTTPGTSVDCAAALSGAGYGTLAFGVGSGDTIDIGAWCKVSSQAFATYGETAGTTRRSCSIVAFRSGSPGEVYSNRPTAQGFWQFVSLRITVPSEPWAWNQNNTPWWWPRFYGPYSSTAGTTPEVRYAGITVRKVSPSDPAMTEADLIVPGVTSGAAWRGTANASPSARPRVARVATVTRTSIEQPSARNIWPNETFESSTIGSAPTGITAISGGGGNGSARINQVVGGASAVDGAKSWRLAFTTNGQAQVSEAGWMSTVTPVKPGDRISTTLIGRVDSTLTSPYNTLVVQYVWRDASGATILNNYPGTSPPLGAFTYSTTATAPAGAASVLMAVFIQQAGPTYPLAGGTLDMTLDSIVVAREPDVLSRTTSASRADPTWVGGVPVENATVAKKALLIWRTGGDAGQLQGRLQAMGWTVDAVMSSAAPPALERDGWRTQALTGGYSLVCFDWRVWSATPILDLAYELYNVYGISVLTTGNDTTSSAGCPIWTGTSAFQTNFGTLINTTGRENHPLGARWSSTFNDTDIKNSFAGPRSSATVWAHAIDTERGGIQLPMALAESAGLNGAKFVHVQPSCTFWPSWLKDQIFSWIAPDRGVGRQVANARAITDAMPLSDASSRVAAVARAIADGTELSESVTRLFAGARGSSEVMTPGDLPGRQIISGRAAAETFALAVMATRAVIAARRAEEALSFADAVDALQDLRRALLEQFTVSVAVASLRAGPQNVVMDIRRAYLATLAVAAAYDAALHDSPAFTAELKVT